MPTAEEEATRVEYLMSREANLIDNHALPTILTVEYPGLVKNIDKAIRNLGGKHAIDGCWYRPRETLHLNQTNRPQPSSKLYLHFRPKDQMSHPLISDDQILEETRRTIIVVGKRYRKRKLDESGNWDGSFKYKTVYKFAGYSPFTYTFSSLADFQILPIDGEARPFQRDKGILMDTLKSPKFFLETSKRPLFVVPSKFSRFDRADYRYNYSDVNSKSVKDDGKQDKNEEIEREDSLETDDRPNKIKSRLMKNTSAKNSGKNGIKNSNNNDSTADEDEPNNQTGGIGKGRRFRGRERNYQLSFNKLAAGPLNSNLFDEIEQPTEEEISNFCKTSKNRELYEKVQELFSKRPMWLFKAIEANLLGTTYDNVKAVMPLVAYHVLDGAWQRTWCVYGYDPSAQFNSREASRLQVIDFRINNQVKKIKPEFLPHLKGLYIKEKSLEILNTSKRELAKIQNDESKLLSQPEYQILKADLDSFYCYISGILPPTQQVYYQICDVKMDRVEQIMNTALLNGNCTPHKAGWFEEKKLTAMGGSLERNSLIKVYNVPEYIRRVIKQDIEITLKRDIEKIRKDLDYID